MNVNSNVARASALIHVFCKETFGRLIRIFWFLRKLAEYTTHEASTGFVQMAKK